MEKLIQACKRNEQEAERKRYAAKANADEEFRGRFRAIYGGGSPAPGGTTEAPPPPPQKPKKPRGGRRNRNGKK